MTSFDSGWKAGLCAALSTLLLTACASSSRWVPEMPDFSSWFSAKENQVIVSEVDSDSYCNAPGEASALTLLADSAAVKAWEATRGVSLSGDVELPLGPYVVADLGQRNSGGYGIAVSRQAGLKDDILVLRATVFEPSPGAASTQAITSPCSLVRLPQMNFASLRLIDQSGKVRASLQQGSQLQ
ncbi:MULTISPECIES: protease complex subunit PrcB family protein [Hydrocarboniphaga]|jgi:hypothetical protein|uniref:PrcB C-terminal domain-containing protein n=1 Tax=Hydrocarboniphaga effusa AP103 TaxID=1172194 RepID=I7ZCG8_9GAMM|nr:MULTISPECIES: protease complex subunit PrcB family protein [Hydrocarboniphaga]EIT69554.1 hypothetical protein WQQ_31360 [Hydrocarboniphaga effusa AP103]MDZ4080133.1 protease complex subunit PrcB family protein [Hydrocarboniphaga sp.]